MRLNNPNRKQVGTMIEGRMTSKVSKLLSDAAETYHERGLPEGALLATVVLSALVEADVTYFEGPDFKLHCELLPDIRGIKIDHPVMLANIRKMYS